MSTNAPTGAGNLKDRAYSRKEVVQIIRSVLESTDKNSEQSIKLHNELSTIATYIENMKSELAQMRSIEISHNHIPAASDELDAAVEETAKATGTIMDVCEKIEKIAGTLPQPANGELTTAVTSIYEACGFQDITGQRITKVVKTLKNIELKVSEIISHFGHTGEEEKSKEEAPSLLNGPQLKGAASTQEDIDKLLASFG